MLEFAEAKQGKRRKCKEKLSGKLDADVLALARVAPSSFASKQRHGLLDLRQPLRRSPNELPVRPGERAARRVPAPRVQLVARQHCGAAAAEPRGARPGQQQLAPLGEGPPEDEGALRSCCCCCCCCFIRVAVGGGSFHGGVEPRGLPGGDGVGEEGGARLSGEAAWCFF